MKDVAKRNLLPFRSFNVDRICFYNNQARWVLKYLYGSTRQEQHLLLRDTLHQLNVYREGGW